MQEHHSTVTCRFNQWVHREHVLLTERFFVNLSVSCKIELMMVTFRNKKAANPLRYYFVFTLGTAFVDSTKE